jgi:hypothetical protein
MAGSKTNVAKFIQWNLLSTPVSVGVIFMPLALSSWFGLDAGLGNT